MLLIWAAIHAEVTSIGYIQGILGTYAVGDECGYIQGQSGCIHLYSPVLMSSIYSRDHLWTGRVLCQQPGQHVLGFTQPLGFSIGHMKESKPVISTI